MHSRRLFSLIVVIGAMVLAIALTISARAAAPRGTSIDEALLLNLHDPRPIAALHAATEFDVEQARLGWRAGTPVASAQNSTGNTLDQQTRDATQAHWLALHGGTNRTCVLLCGGW